MRNYLIVGMVMVAALTSASVVLAQESSASVAETDAVKVDPLTLERLKNAALRLENAELYMRDIRRNAQDVVREREALIAEAAKAANVSTQTHAIDLGRGVWVRREKP